MAASAVLFFLELFFEPAEGFFDTDARFFFAGAGVEVPLVADSSSASSTTTSGVLSKSQRESDSG